MQINTNKNKGCYRRFILISVYIGT